MIFTSAKEATIVLRIEADYIYNSNTVILEFSSSSPFYVSIKSEILIIELSQGTFDNRTKVYRAEGEDNVFTIKLLTLGLFKETSISNADNINEAVDSYGMQFFPFISSRLSLEFISLSLPIKSIILRISDSFRIVWYRRKVENPQGEEAKVNHSYSQTEASYIFTWNKSTFGEYKFDVLLRLSGNSLWQIVDFPRFYFYVALIAIAVASFHEQFSVLYAAIIAVWLFLMGHWAKINMPQQNTIITKVYLFFLSVSFIWGILWKIHWKVGLLSIIIIGIILKSFKDAIKFFTKEALLPPLWEKFFYKLNDRRDNKNRAALEEQNVFTLIDTKSLYDDQNTAKKKIDTPEDGY